MPSTPRICGLILFVCCAAAFALGESPYITRVQRLPTSVRQLSCFVETAHGQFAGCAQGLLTESGGGWALVKIPDGGEVVALASISGDGLFVAGKGACYIYSSRAWTRVPLDDDVVSVVGGNGHVLLTGRRGVYEISEGATVRKLGVLSTKTNVYLHRIGDEIVGFSATDGAMLFRSGRVENADKSFPWMAGRTAISIQKDKNGDVLAATNKGIILAGGGGVTPLLNQHWSSLAKAGVIAIRKSGKSTIVATYLGGVEAFETLEGRSLWRLSTEDLGGNVYFMQDYHDGFIIGTSSGLFVLAAPEAYRAVPLPTGDVRYVTQIAGRPFISTTAGVFNESASLIDVPGPVHSCMEDSMGRAVIGSFGKLYIDGTAVPVGGREVSAMAECGGQNIAFLQPHGVSILKPDGSIVVVTGVSNGISLGTAESDRFLVGTIDGFYQISSDGLVVSRFGRGMATVKRIGDANYCFDGEGNCYDRSGKQLGAAPISNIIGSATIDGIDYVLGQTNDGEYAVGTYNPSKQQWRPVDIPLPSSPQGLIASGEDMVVVGSTELLLCHRFNPLIPEAFSLSLGAGSNKIIPSQQSSIIFSLPRGRLAPWSSPTFRWRIGAGSWVHESGGADVEVQRLGYGRNVITVERAWGQLTDVTTLEIVRLYPWWMTWPAFVGYLALAVLATYCVVRWRTHQMSVRAAELEEKLLERTHELRKAQKVQEEFFSTLSHEIRNPLNGVVGICDILTEAGPGAIAPRERYLVRTLHGCASQLKSLLDDILDFSRINRGMLILKEEVFDLKSSIEGAAVAIDARLQKCHITLPEDNVWLRGDCPKIRQIISNLVSNALKYGTPDFAHISATVEILPGGRARLICSVKNTGRTIPAEEQERIFESYTRGLDAVKENIQGHGLGLTVSRRVARAMKGDLVVTSTNGLTEFKLVVELPIEAKPNESVQNEEKPRVSKALGIEDEDYNRLVIGYMLNRLGYEVDWAVDGKTAMERIETTTYDLILTDFFLPDIKGPELVRRMIAKLPEPRPPILAVTAYSTAEILDEAKAAGISGFVPKPVTRSNLEAAILSAAPKISLRTVLDPVEESYNFTYILKLADGRLKLAEYADGLIQMWSEILEIFAQKELNRALASKRVHAYRSRVLAVEAIELGSQVGLLERAVEEATDDEIKKLLGVIGPMVDNLAAASRSRALA